MSRRPALPQRRGRGIVAHEPEEGFWLFRWVKGGPLLPASISRIDHEPGSVPRGMLDAVVSKAAQHALPFFIANVGWQDVDPIRVWTGRRERVLTKIEYEFQMARLKWIKDYSPAEPEAQPRRPVDISTIAPIGPRE